LLQCRWFSSTANGNAARDVKPASCYDEPTATYDEPTAGKKLLISLFRMQVTENLLDRLDFVISEVLKN